MHYYLSNSQIKDLDRGTEIEIAVPAPTVDPENVYHWARTVIDPEWTMLVTHVRRDSLWVSAIKSIGEDETLTEHLGAIVEPRPGILVVRVNVVIITLTPERRRHRGKRVRWPAYCEMDGQQLP